MSQYADSARDLSRQWQESRIRTQTLMEQIDERFLEPDWQAAVIVEARLWRELLNQVPDDVPKLARGLRASMLRWFALSADVGDAMIAALEAGDIDQLTTAAARIDDATALAAEATESGTRLTERLERQHPPRHPR
jgi:hypothetical protein